MKIVMTRLSIIVIIMRQRIGRHSQHSHSALLDSGVGEEQSESHVLPTDDRKSRQHPVLVGILRFLLDLGNALSGTTESENPTQVLTSSCEVLRSHVPSEPRCDFATVVPVV